MVTLAEVMDWGLYFEEVQQLAREHGLPVSRTKDELIQELIESDELDPAEVVAFVRVDMLRSILQEMGLPSGASREVLAARLVEALSSHPRLKTGVRKSRSKPSATQALVLSSNQELEPPRKQEGATRTAPLESTGTFAPPAQQAVNLHLSPPSSPPPIVQLLVPRPERPSAAWGFTGILMAIVIGGALYLAVSLLGVDWGVLAAAIGAVLLAIALLASARWWVRWVDRLAGR